MTMVMADADGSTITPVHPGSAVPLYPRVPTTLMSDASTASLVTVAGEVLKSYSVPAGFFKEDDRLEIIASGTFAAVIDSRLAAFVVNGLAGTGIGVLVGDNAGANTGWFLHASIVRVGETFRFATFGVSNPVTGYAAALDPVTSGMNYNDAGVLAYDLDDGFTLDVAAIGTNVADVTVDLVTIMYCPAP